MDKAERLAEEYLNDLGMGSVVFEPDDNIPPDFALADSIGVEVRRLNQNYKHPDGSTKALEELGIPLWQGVKKLLGSCGSSVNGESWFVGIDYRRPVGDWRQLKGPVRQKLAAFKNQSVRKTTSINLRPEFNFNLDLYSASTDQKDFFVLAGIFDGDLGGWVMSEYIKNLPLCILEKEKKIEPHRGRYREWWLVLSDHIDYSMDQEDREVFRTEIIPTLQHKFDRIVLLDPYNQRSAFEF